MKLGVTGGTGFVGGHLLRIAVEAGHELRALTRRPQPPRDRVTWVPGALDDPASLAALVEGCDAVVHVAGVISGDADAFRRGNVLGTEAMLAAAQSAGIRRFVHISSLAAREPQLSAYGASKLASEAPIAAFPGIWTILRPPAIYGPGDREVLEFFRMARRGLVLLPSGGRLSVIAAEDLCRLILACLDGTEAAGQCYEPDDGRPGGWGTVEFARAIGQAVGRRVLPLPLPHALLRLGATADRLARGAGAKLTADRVAYFTHPDWTAAAERHPPADLWRAQVPTPEGLAATARWYRTEGWL